MTKNTYATPVVTSLGQVAARTLGANRYAVETVMKKP